MCVCVWRGDLEEICGEIHLGFAKWTLHLQRHRLEKLILPLGVALEALGSGIEGL